MKRPKGINEEDGKMKRLLANAMLGVSAFARDARKLLTPGSRRTAAT
jgi:hypothetical protein